MTPEERDYSRWDACQATLGPVCGLMPALVSVIHKLFNLVYNPPALVAPRLTGMDSASRELRQAPILITTEPYLIKRVAAL
jgi:hypothetical protein